MLADPKEYFIASYKKYLFILSYRARGDFDTIAETWDLSTGVVKPNSGAEEEKVKAGRSSIVGLTEDKLIPTLQELLPDTQ